MKKTTISTLLFLVFTLCLSAQDKRPVASNIDKVTVFLSGAQITRSAKTELPAGKTELVFKNISPNIDKASIQLKGEGAFTILSVIHQINRLEEQTRQKEILELEAQKRRKTEEKQVTKARLNVARQEQSMLEKNQSIGGANNGVSTAELRQAVDFQRIRMTEVLMNQLELERDIFRADSILTKLDKQLVELKQKKELSTSEIIVAVSAKSATTAKFELSYYVRDAGWFVNYDLRVKDVSNPIELSYKANVFQSSGEDWKQVKLTLSSGDPSQNGVAQELEPWLLRYGYVVANPNTGGTGRGGITQVSGVVLDKETGEPLIGATIRLQGSSVGAITDFNGQYILNIPPTPATMEISYTGYTTQTIPVNSTVINIAMVASIMLNEVVIKDYKVPLLGRAAGVSPKKQSRADKTIAMITQETYQATSFSFEIEMPYTILNDGKTYTVDIKTETVPAAYEYFAAPKLDENAYLTAHITNWQDLNLLDGEVNIFFEGAYLGKSLLDTRNAADTMDVSLGQDKSIAVHRTKLKDFSSRQFIGANKTERRAFEITVKNNKKETVQITIQDQFPISTNKDIVVEDLKYDGAELEKETQLLLWKLTLAPKEEKKLQLQYAVKYPKKETLVLE